MMNNMAEDEKKLYNLIANSLDCQICFKYKVFFDNKHIENIFANTNLLNKFQELLVKIERNEKPEYEDGTVLRNMLEIIIWKKWSFKVRGFLNNHRSYNCDKPDIFDQWLKSTQCYRHVPTANDRDNLKRDYKDDKKVDDIINCTTVIIEGILNICYRTAQKTFSDPPKYIFSYIDNVYTVTSEWSSHGKNQTTTQALSLEGWKTLVFGMCQILQWLAKKNPNPPSLKCTPKVGHNL